MLPRHPRWLETARLLLEPLDARHAHELFYTLADDELYRYIPTEPYASVDLLAARYAHVARGPLAEGERWWNWALVGRCEPRRAFGTLEISIDRDGTHALLAYALGRDSWGAGFATEAARAAIDELRSATHIREIETFIDSRNRRSIALVERLGFTRKGFIANADYFKGSTSDEVVFALALREDDDAETSSR
jgi:ribosomal-protein-alanine N-acetyltransferase